MPSLATNTSIRPSPFDVAGDDAEAVADGGAQPGAIGDVGERAVAVVAEQQVGCDGAS